MNRLDFRPAAPCAMRRGGRARGGRATVVLLLMALCGVAGLLGAVPAQAERLKEVASIQGVRTNQLIGYGLMVGLDGTGDQTTQAPFTAQSMKSMLQQLGVQLPPGVTPQLKNSAAVVVTAQLPAFAQPGQLIDVTVSSVGNEEPAGRHTAADAAARRGWRDLCGGTGQCGGGRRGGVGWRQQGADQPSERRTHS